MKASKAKQVRHKDRPIRIAAESLTKSVKVRRAWNDMFEDLKDSPSQPITAL